MLGYFKIIKECASMLVYLCNWNMYAFVYTYSLVDIYMFMYTNKDILRSKERMFDAH